MVENFEKEFAAFCHTERGVAVNSGTDALRFALIAAGVKPGDVAVTVPNTFIATTEAISQAGALPEFVDIDERTYNMDPGKLRQFLETKCTVSEDGKLISKGSKRPVTAIVPVHLYGQMVDMDAILELAERYRLIVIEDACQAHGAECFSRKHNRWFKAGSMGRAAAFSFYPGKNLGACGEGGAITTNNARVADAAKMLRDHGQAKKYYHDVEGYNGRLDAIQTGILSVKLKHLYVVRTADREGLMAHLAKAGIGTGIHYPIPLHRQRAYDALGYKAGDFPVCEKIAAEIVSLPMFPSLTSAQQARVVHEIVAFNAKFTCKPAEADVTALAEADRTA
jgi:dTDP-4-amino-4,6-dideoxygalactose transaminase